MLKLSVALATYNEEANLQECLKAVKNLADEIIVVDGRSTDATREIAKKYGAQVIVRENPPIFHLNKQVALENCRGDWVLQLDADERVSPELAREIKTTVRMPPGAMEKHQRELAGEKLFQKHQALVEARDGKIGRESGEYAGFFVPRLNYFLGKFLRYGGVYPDGVIRLVKKGKARFPCRSVHEQIVVEGRVGWLARPLYHYADTSFKKYFYRNSRYIDLIASELHKEKIGKNPLQAFNYFVIKPLHWFLLTQIRHKGILDGWRGIVFSFFSSLRFPRAYWRFLVKDKMI